MVSLPAILTPHTVTVRDKTGNSAYGPVHADPRTVDRCRVEDVVRLVRDEDGQEVVSSTRVFVRPEYGPVPVGSLVTLPSGREATVLHVAHHHTPPAPEHYELALT